MSHHFALPDHRTLAIEPGETTLAATLRQGVPHACGGRAECSTCRVQVLEGLLVNDWQHAHGDGGCEKK